jgi:hypothetical protein
VYEARQAAVGAGPGDPSSPLNQGMRDLHIRGNLSSARRWFDEAYRRAEAAGDSATMAAAAVGLGGLRVHEHRLLADAARVEARQQAALAGVQPGSALNLRLRARLAAETDHQAGRHSSIMAMLAEARGLGDPTALAECLSLAHHCLPGPDHVTTRLTLVGELLREASRTHRRSDVLMGLLWRASDLFMSADPHAERALVELCDELGRRPHEAIGFVVSALHVMRAIRAGRFDDAEELAAACAERGRRAGDADAVGWHGAQLVTIRWYQGRIAEMVGRLAELVHSPTLSAPDNSCLAALAVAAATAGDRRLAESALARIRGRDLADVLRSASWLVSMNGVIEAANLLGDPGCAQEAYDLLSPFARLPMVAGPGYTCFGSVHQALGVASLTMGRIDRAIEHLRSAVRDNTALGHWPAAAVSRHRLGQALSADGDRPAAETELTMARTEAVGLGLRLPALVVLRSSAYVMANSMAAPAVGLRTTHTAGPDQDNAADADAPAPLPVFRCRGRQWRIELGPRTAWVDDSVGLRHLATLVANPGIEIAAIDLAAGSSYSRPGPDREWHSGPVVLSKQAMLDDVAVREYRRRLERLRGEIDDAEGGHDGDRVERLRTEWTWLTDELTRAAGLQGRPRRFTDDAERARIAVGKAIRRALKRIDAADHVIGAELGACVQTGLRCCYRP